MTKVSAPIAAAASQIAALINSRLVSPRQDEIEAILAKAIAADTVSPDGSSISPRRDAWRTLIAEHDAAYCVSGNLPAEDPREEAAQAASLAADDRLEALHEELWATPARNSADIRLLGEICFRKLWPGHDLTAANSDAKLEEVPHCYECKALGALLRAVRDLGPTSALPVLSRQRRVPHG
jgi:hypothetical protein